MNKSAEKDHQISVEDLHASADQTRWKWFERFESGAFDFGD